MNAGLCSASKRKPYRYENVPVPAAVDWREKGIVGPIKDQVWHSCACTSQRNGCMHLCIGTKNPFTQRMFTCCWDSFWGGAITWRRSLESPVYGETRAMEAAVRNR